MSNDISLELQDVERLLFSVPADLGPPLHDLVEGQVNALTPYVRASFVLAAGTNEANQQDLRAKRVNLAVALETLFLALNIHKHLLVDESSPNGLASNKSFLGSMILAGDYCFSRSAEFAAKTNEPTVVAIFSNVLAKVSEGHLRKLHGEESVVYNEMPDLIMGGVHAAIALSRPSEGEEKSIIEISKALIDTLDTSDDSNQATSTPPYESQALQEKLSRLSPNQQIRWRFIIETILSNAKY